MDLDTLTTMANSDNVPLSPEQLHEFYEHPVWKAVRNMCATRHCVLFASITNPRTPEPEIRIAQGELSALKWIVGTESMLKAWIEAEEAHDKEEKGRNEAP